MKKDTAKYKISPKGKRKLDYPLKKTSRKLPLIGKTIYLDVKELKHVKRLSQDLKKLGATLEEFVSRDIDYLITTQPRPKTKGPPVCGDDIPSPSPFNCDPSPSPGNPEDKKVTSVTRGKALAEKARNTSKTNTLLDNAEKWGVKIVSLEGAYKWIDKELKKLPKSPGVHSKKSSKISCVSSYKIFKSPFIKIEAESFYYRPFHTELEKWPRLNVDTPRGSCPFDGTLIKGGDDSREERGDLLAAQVDIPSAETPEGEKNVVEETANTPKLTIEPARRKSDTERGGRILTAGELKRTRELKRKQDRKRGYCECCHVKYEDLDRHVREEQHRLYVKDKSHYQELDMLITSGRTIQNFLYDYLSKAASLAKFKTSSTQHQTRCSPRKAVQEQTIQSLIRCSPRKCQQEELVQSVIMSPRKTVQKNYIQESIRSTGRSPKKYESPLINKENMSLLSPRRSQRNSENHTKSPQNTNNSNLSTVVHGENLNDNSKQVAVQLLHSSSKELSPVNRHVTVSVDGSRKVCLSPRMSRISAEAVRSSPRKKLCLDFNVDGCSQDNASTENPSTQNKEISLKRPGSSQDTEITDVNTVINVTHEKEINKCASMQNSETSSLTATESVKTIESDANIYNRELTKAGFSELVKCGKYRASFNRSSDDFEVCFARTFRNEHLPEYRKPVSLHQTFDSMVTSCVTQMDDDDDDDDDEKADTDGKRDYGNKKAKESSRKKVKNEKTMKKNQKVSEKLNRDVKNKIRKEKETDFMKDGISKDNETRDKSQDSEKSKKTNAEKSSVLDDIYDIDAHTDISSDFQCYDSSGKLLTFSKTLAERIKERAVSRRAYVKSYNVNLMFQHPSRYSDNSCSSIKSGNSDHNKMNLQRITKKMSINKNGSSIASAKVVNKYRNRQFGVKHNDFNQKGYHADDEHEDSPKVITSAKRPTQNKQKKTFWEYVPVVSNAKTVNKCKLLTNLPNEIRKLQDSYMSCASSDDASRQSRRKRNCFKLSEDLEQVNVQSNVGREVYCKDIKEVDSVSSSKVRESVSSSKLAMDKNLTKNASEQVLNSNNEEAEFQHNISNPTTNSTLLNESEYEELKENDVKEEGNKNGDGNVKRTGTKLQSNRDNKYWHYVEQSVLNTAVDEESLKEIPKELRLLRDSWTTAEILNRQSRRCRNQKEFEELDLNSDSTDQEKIKNRQHRKKSQTVKKQNKFEGSATENSDLTDHDETQCGEKEPESKYLKDQKKFNKIFGCIAYDQENKAGDENANSTRKCTDNKAKRKENISGDSDIKEKKTTKKTKRKFWDYVVEPFSESLDENNEANTPKELKDLKIPKESLFLSDFGSNNKKLSERKIKSACRGRQLLIRNTNLNYCEIESENSQITYQDSESDSGDVKSDEHLSKELQDLKQFNANLSNGSICETNRSRFRKRSLISYKEYFSDDFELDGPITNKTISKCGEKHMTKRTDLSELNNTENSNNDLNDQNRDSSQNEMEGGSEIISIIPKKNKAVGNNNGIDINVKQTLTFQKNNIENEIENQRPRTMSRKRKVLWEYEVVTQEEKEIAVDKTLPKELQKLCDSWNDVTNIENSRKRSRSRHSAEEGNDSKQCNSESKLINYENCKNGLFKGKRQVIARDTRLETKMPDTRGNVMSQSSHKQLNQVNNCVDNSAYGTETGGLCDVNDSDFDTERSTSPVFNVSQPQSIKVRKGSPIFKRSPRPLLKHKGSLESLNKQEAGMKIAESSVADYVSEIPLESLKSSWLENKFEKERVKSEPSRSIDFNEYCPDSEEENDQIERKIKNKLGFSHTTPEKSGIERKEHGSGYSSTPREKRRKQWKRKILDNNDESEVPVQKRRKLYKLKYDVSERENSSNNEMVKAKSPQKRLLNEEGQKCKILNKDKRNCQNILNLNTVSKENTIEGMDGMFPVIWRSLDDDTEQCYGEKENQKISAGRVSGERTKTHVDKMKSLHVLSHAESSSSKMVLKSSLEDVEDKSDNELERYVPALFSSPNKCSNSSWDDALDTYIDNSVKHGPDSSFKGANSSLYFSFHGSPRKSPLKVSDTAAWTNSDGIKSPSKLNCRTPQKHVEPQKTKNKERKSDVTKVDDEIEFNFGSPQKTRSDFSPLRSVNGVVQGLSSPRELHFTSTPDMKSKKHRHDN